MVSLMTALIETVHFQVSDVVVLLGSCIECLHSNGGCSVCTTAATLTFLPLMTGVFLKSAINCHGSAESRVMAVGAPWRRPQRLGLFPPMASDSLMTSQP